MPHPHHVEGVEVLGESVLRPLAVGYVLDDLVGALLMFGGLAAFSLSNVILFFAYNVGKSDSDIVSSLGIDNR